MRLFTCLWFVSLIQVAASAPAGADERPPMGAVDLSYSTRAGLAGRVSIESRKSSWLFPAVRAEIPLSHAFRDDVATAPRPAGTSPARAGIAVDFGTTWWHPGFAGFVRAGVAAGLADATWPVWGGVEAVVDLDYVQLYGEAVVWGSPMDYLAWRGGAFVRPYIRFLQIWYDCDSRDGRAAGAQEGAAPCGLGLALRFKLPGTPVSLLGGGKATFHDLEGHVVDSHGVGGRLFLTILFE